MTPREEALIHILRINKTQRQLANRIRVDLRNFSNNTYEPAQYLGLYHSTLPKPDGKQQLRFKKPLRLFDLTTSQGLTAAIHPDNLYWD